MNLTNSLLEQYILEIISRARAIKGRVQFILSQDNPTAPAEKLAKTLIEITIYLENILAICANQIKNDNNDDVILKKYQEKISTIAVTINRIGSHVMLIDLAKTEHLPWSAIKAFEKIISKLIHGENPDILLIPQWEWNYSVAPKNIQTTYYDLLKNFEYDAPEINIKQDVLHFLDKPMYRFVFPFVERKNIGLHSLLGHELGHLLADKYINTAIDGMVSTVKDDITKLVEVKMSESPYDKSAPIYDFLFKKLFKEYLEVIVEIWKRGLEELLSDTVGAYLFGPAVVFATYDIAYQVGLDRAPRKEEEYYPPFRMRLRNLMRILGKDYSGMSFFPISKSKFPKLRIDRINEIWKHVDDLANDDADEKIISNNELTDIAYKYIKHDLLQGEKHLAASLGLEKIQISPQKLYEHLPHLIDRLANNVPPNAIECKEGLTPATIVEIINSSWLYKLSWNVSMTTDGKLNEDYIQQRDLLNNLVLKAIEYSDLGNSETRMFGN